MSNPNTTITTEKLLEKIGLQAVELDIYRHNHNQLLTENQQLRDELQRLKVKEVETK